jgi:hypothetical protein
MDLIIDSDPPVAVLHVAPVHEIQGFDAQCLKQDSRVLNLETITVCDFFDLRGVHLYTLQHTHLESTPLAPYMN